MKTLENHTLLYDADCPMCRLYTGAFVSRGWLDTQGRQAFQQVDDAMICNVDPVKAQSEIALVNRNDKQVFYGVDALFLIVSHRWPLLKPVFRLRLFRWLMQKVYFFISYNRKIIAAVKPGATARQECKPAYNFWYRAAYLVFAALLTALFLRPFNTSGGFYTSLSIIIAIMGLQAVIAALVAKDKVMDYLGNTITVALIGGLLLVPFSLLNYAFQGLPGIVSRICGLVWGSFLIGEYLRRTRLLGTGILLNISLMLLMGICLFFVLI